MINFPLLPLALFESQYFSLLKKEEMLNSHQTLLAPSVFNYKNGTWGGAEIYLKESQGALAL